MVIRFVLQFSDYMNQSTECLIIIDWRGKQDDDKQSPKDNIIDSGFRLIIVTAMEKLLMKVRPRILLPLLGVILMTVWVALGKAGDEGLVFTDCMPSVSSAIWQVHLQ